MTARFVAVLGFVAIASQAAAQSPYPAIQESQDMRLSFARLPPVAIDEAQDPQPSSERDSVLNGVLIGAAIGGGLGLIPDYYDDCEECHDSLYASIAVGAGVGLLVDLLRDDRRPVSPQSPRALRLDAAVTPNRLRLGGAIRW